MSSNGAEGYEYKHQDCRDENVADGPQPMRNYKPSQTTPNSADQFRQTHQAEYEARGKRSTDQVERARRHNATYPELKDELNRRRSTAKITTAKGRRLINIDSVCSVCLKLKRRALKKKPIRTRRQGRRIKKNKTREKEFRTSKCTRYGYRKQNRVNKNVCSSREGSVVLTENKSRSDVDSYKNPSTVDPSVSSYHSYPSIDHEPMVS